MEEKPVEADEVNPDDAEEVSLDNAEEVSEPQEITLDFLVTQFIRGTLIFTISINLAACHCGGSFAVSHHFIVLLCRRNRNV